MTTEIIDLTNDEVNYRQKYPILIEGAVGSNLGYHPLICGGIGPYSSVKQCHRLVVGGWQKFATMISKRSAAAGIVHGDSLMVLGGVNEKSTEFINENGQVSKGPNMPKALFWHAIARVNTSTAIISGGRSNANYTSPLTWYYSHETKVRLHGVKIIMERLHLLLPISGLGAGVTVNKFVIGIRNFNFIEPLFSARL